MERIRLSRISGPTIEPISLALVKKQLEIASEDGTHDEFLTQKIQAARELWEDDTSTATTVSQWVETFETLADGMQLHIRPVIEIVSIQYYDLGGDVQTLDSDLYELDADTRQIRLTPGAVIPAIGTRWNAVKVTVNAGYTEPAEVPATAQQAMILRVANWFENRDMMIADNIAQTRAYDSLVSRYMRSNYP